MSPKTIAREGASREKIRVYEQTVRGNRLVRVRWRQDGQRLTRSWPYTQDNLRTAKAFAKGIAEGREIRQDAPPTTLRQLWNRFVDAEYHSLRPKTQKLYREYWLRWEIMWGADFVVSSTTLPMVAEFRSALTGQKKAISTIRHSIETVKMVYKWGTLNKLIPTSEIALYRFKIAKEQRKAPPPEYQGNEGDRLLAALNPTKATEWRAFVALALCRFQGVRQNSALHLQWSDVKDAVVTWRAPFDKMGNEWTQPLRQQTEAALTVAMLWREKMGYTGPWVIPSGSRKNRGECYTIGALYLALRGAETRAGIKHLPQRGGHGLRRLLAGDINAVTGDPALAMMAINDDIRQAGKYIQKRDDRVRDAFALLDGANDEK